MNFRTNITRQALVTIGACFGLLFLAGPAGARPDAGDAFTRSVANHGAYHASHTGIPDSVTAAIERNSAAPAATADPLVIPYLSHGEGVLVGEDGLPQPQPTVVPYLSHGFGVEASSTPTLSERPDGFQPQLRGVDSTTVAVAGDGFDWETTGAVGGALLAAMALGLMATIALRHRGGLRSA